MKRILFNLISCFSFAIIVSCNDVDNNEKAVSDTDVPAEVKSAFSAKYSTATEVKWDDAREDTLTTYKAKFMLNGRKMKAEFDSRGNFLKEEEDN